MADKSSKGPLDEPVLLSGGNPQIAKGDRPGASVSRCDAGLEG